MPEMMKEADAGAEIDMLTGGSIPGAEQPAFRLFMPADIPVPVVVAAPHGGRAYPTWLQERMRDHAGSSLRLEDRYIDLVADALAKETGAGLIVAEAPRALLDLNRASDDMDWDMVEGGAPPSYRKSLSNRRARGGLGLVPRRLSKQGEIWNRRMTRADLDDRIASVHLPYHRELGALLEKVRDRWSAALLIDLHSMPPLRRRYPDQQAPEFVIGDRFGASCDPMISARALSYFARHDRLASHNRPYAGGYVLDRHARPLRGVHALQVEICRTSYLDSRLVEPSARLPGVVRLLAGLIRDLASCTAGLGRDEDLALAAE